MIDARGKSSALSAANAIANHLKDWLAFPDGANGGISMGVFSGGNPYGVPDDLFFSFPVECGEGTHSGGDVWGPCGRGRGRADSTEAAIGALCGAASWLRPNLARAKVILRAALAHFSADFIGKGFVIRPCRSDFPVF